MTVCVICGCSTGDDASQVAWRCGWPDDGDNEDEGKGHDDDAVAAEGEGEVDDEYEKKYECK